MSLQSARHSRKVQVSQPYVNPWESSREILMETISKQTKEKRVFRVVRWIYKGKIMLNQLDGPL